MAKTKISEWSTTPASNTDIDGINIAEGCAPSGINDAIRDMMAQIRSWQSGATGDPFAGPVSGAVNATVGATTPTTGAFTTLSASSTVTLSGGTANGVTYLNGSKVLTSGSALTFDGTNLGVGMTPIYKLDVTGGNGNAIRFTDSVNSVQVAMGAYNSTGFIGTLSNHPQLFYVNGGEQMRLTSTGLGIGTTSPSYKLDVQTGAGRFQVRDLGGSSVKLMNSTAGGNIGLDSAGGITLIYANGTENARFDASGNLGLGVTPSAWSTYKALQIGTGSLFNGTVGGTDYTIMASNAYTDTSSTYKYIGTNFATAYYQFGGKHAWFNAPSGTAGNAISFTQAMTLDASGNLGVGTSSPSYRIDAYTASNTTLRLGTTTATAGTGTLLFEIANNFSGVSQAYIKGNGFGNSGLSYLTFGVATTSGATTATEVARIDTSGNLLVGMTSYGVTNAGASLSPTASSSFYVAGGTALTVGRGTSDGIAVQFNRSGTNCGSISVTTTTTTYATSSDYRLKNTIAPMTGALDRVSALKPVTYKWNADGSDGEGFIAHELAEVCPHAVVGEKDAVDDEGNIKPQGIDTSFLVATLTAAIQEQQAIIETLKADVAALKGTV